MAIGNRHCVIRRLVLSVVLLGVSAGALADDGDFEWERDLDFLVRLGQERFDFYAEMQRKAMTKKYTNRRDDLKLANAVYFFSVHKPQEAENYLRGLNSSHKLYNRSLYIRGTKYAELGMYNDSAKNFKLYFQRIPEAPKNKRGKKEFVMALQYYSKVLQELGRGNEAAALIDKMPPDDNMGERELTYLKQLSRIEAEEGKLEDGKRVNTQVLNTAMEELKKLFFVRDGISALAASQVCRIQGILGNDLINGFKSNRGGISRIQHFLLGIKTVKQFEDFIVEMEQGNSKSSSPMPEALYYKAIAIMGQAEVTAAKGNLRLAGKQLARGAVVYFKMIQKDYRKSPFVQKLPKQYLRCEAINEKWKLNAKLNLPKASKGDLAAVFQPGDILLRQGDNAKNRNEALKCYNEAAKRYANALEKNRKNPAVTNYVANYMRCLAMADRLDEGKKILEDLEKSFPDEKSGIGKAALMLGAFANKRMHEWPKNRLNPLKAKQESIYFWARNMFVDNDPSHPQAPVVAYDLAVTKFNEAIVALKNAREKAPAARKAAEDKALKMVAEVIPYYQRVADVFPMHPKGKAALMKIGQLYNILDKRDAAIEYFSRYLKADDGTLPKESLLEAQYYLAELQYRSNRPVEARENYLKVKALTDPGKPYANLSNTKQFREIAMAYIPDAIDRVSDLLSNQIGTLEERKNALANGMYDLDLQIRSWGKEIAALPEQEKQIRERTEELKRVLQSYELDYKGAARAQAKAAAAKPNAAKTEKEFYDLFIQGVEAAATTALSTETTAIATQEKTLSDRELELKQQRSAITAAVAALNRANDRLAKAVEKQRGKIKNIKDSFAAIGKKVEDSKAQCATYEKILNTSKDDSEIKKTKQALEAERKKLSALQNESLDVVSYANKQAIIMAERDILMKQGAISDNQWQLESQKAELALNEIRMAAIEEQRKTLAVRRDFTTQVKTAIEGNEASRLKANAAVKARAKEVCTVIDGAAKKELETLGKLRTKMTQYTKQCQERKGVLSKEQKRIENDLKPMEASWRKQKEEAVRGYRAYLADYPRGEYYARCTTDLAAGLVDLEEYREAVQQLNNLVSGRVIECSDAPGNTKCDPHKTVHALYNLAKAQTKAKRLAEASGTYNRLMNSRHPEVKKAVLGMPLGNLFFIADQGLTVGAPEAALTACEIILNRVRNSAHEASGLRPSQIERVYVKAAEAALLGKDPAKALSMISALLAKNPKTAYLYDVRELEAEALVAQGKMNEGIGMLNQLIRRSNSLKLANRLRCTVARLYLKSTKEEYRKSAQSVYESIVGYAKDNVELNPNWVDTQEARENQEWVDMAFVEVAKLYRMAGDGDKLSKIKGLYRELFPNGKKIGELSMIN